MEIRKPNFAVKTQFLFNPNVQCSALTEKNLKIIDFTELGPGRAEPP